MHFVDEKMYFIDKIYFFLTIFYITFGAKEY